MEDYPPEVIEHICQQMDMKTLKQYTLSSKKMHNICQEVIVKKRRLKPEMYDKIIEENYIYDRLNLSNLGLTSADLPHFKWPFGLKELFLDHNYITDLSTLAIPESLRYLNLSYNHITDLSGLRLNEYFQELILKHNYITDISNLNLNSRLIKLDLSYNHITNVTNPSLRRLKYLFLDHNQITDISGLPKFTHPYLRITLDHNPVTTSN